MINYQYTIYLILSPKSRLCFILCMFGHVKLRCGSLEYRHNTKKKKKKKGMQQDADNVFCSQNVAFFSNNPA
jgi:hypothetical protein